jgi:hypothetical protein
LSPGGLDDLAQFTGDVKDKKDISLFRMKNSFFLVVLLATAALVAVSGNEACDRGTAASPSFEAGPPDGAVETGPADSTTETATSESGVPAPIYAVCPDGMAPVFPSLLTQMFATDSCGSGKRFDCHSSTGALPAAEGGTGSGLDFSLGAAQVYAELLGDGGGIPSNNVAGDAGGVILRVAPGDASASLLYIKLALPTARDPRYGAAMPPVGLPCPAVLDAVRAWINDGAAPE